MVFTSTLGIFYIVLFFVLIYLFFRERDFSFRILYLIATLSVFVLLVHFIYFQTQIDNDNSIILYENGISDFNFDNPTITGVVEVNTTDYVLYRFDNINIKFEDLFSNVEFCFYYNDSDGNNNVITVSNGFVDLSDKIYLNGNTSSSLICSHVNANNVRKGYMLGFNCLDCNNSDSFNILSVSGSAFEYLVNVSDTNDFSIVSTGTPTFFVSAVMLPTEQVNDNYWMFLLCISIFIIVFGLLWGYRLYEDV